MTDMTKQPPPSTERCSAILESIVDFAIIAIDRHGVVTDWNAGAECILGWFSAEMHGQPLARIFTEDDRRRGIVDGEMRLAATNGRADDERWHVRKDGSRFWASGEMMPMRDCDGTHFGYVKVLRDRTREHASIVRQHEDAEFMRSVLAASDDCIKVLDMDLRLQFMSEGGQRVMEVSDFNAIKGCPWLDFWQNESADDARTAIDAAKAGGSGRFQGFANTFAGSPRWWDVQVTPIRDATGSTTRLLSVSRDITRQRLTEGALSTNEDYWRGLFEKLREGLVIGEAIRDGDNCITDWRYVDINPAWGELVGMSSSAAAGRTIREVFPGIEDAWIDDVAEVVSTGTPSSFVRQVGSIERWYEGRTYSLGSDRFAVLFLEVTERVQHERKLLELNETLEERIVDRTNQLQATEANLRQAQKMEAVGQLTGGLAHDFNNLLVGISGSLELMGVRIAQGRHKDVEKYRCAAQGAAKRAAALTHRLLAFSRRQTLAPEVTDVNDLVNGLLELVQRTVGPAIDVQAVKVSGLWPALVDPSQLENALLNLCINARDAMPEGGKITIETGNRWIDRQGGKQVDLPEGQYLSLCVSDNGAGMLPDVAARAFDPFFTTKPTGKGTGLGLSMVYGFAMQSGGQVRIYSEVGEGTTVCIYLPRHFGIAAPAEANDQASVRPVVAAGQTVLIVDDDPTVRMIVSDILADLGYAAIEASDGAWGLRILESDARIDLLITDVGLPGGLNGRQLADAARVHRPDLRVLFITGFAENALLNNGQLEPGMAVLTKPFAMEVLAARIGGMIAAPS